MGSSEFPLSDFPFFASHFTNTIYWILPERALSSALPRNALKKLNSAQLPAIPKAIDARQPPENRAMLINVGRCHSQRAAAARLPCVEVYM